MNHCLNNAEKSALKYYTGDISGNDPFYSEPKAYLVLNSLFYDGISTEKARSAEGKFLNPVILDDVDRLLDFYDNIFSAFRKCHAENDIITYRVERFSDYIFIKQSEKTVSFTSTSTAGFLKEYQDRKGIALMKFLIPVGTACISMTEVLDVYKKSEEAEILLPPFMSLNITEVPVSDTEKSITDADGKSPVVSCIAKCGKIHISERKKNISHEGAKAGQRIYTALNNGTNPSEQDITLYCEWKNLFRELYL
ncbi:MAG: hypothetical protein K2I06_04360 [Ruminococcus sp.]|nr:hypothetical protein [Ruminococcus sp.]